MTRSVQQERRRGLSQRLQGFTLIELIAVLFLVGILGALAAVGLNQSVRAYMIATENANVAQKAQLAMTRLGLELNDCRQGCVGVPALILGSLAGNPIQFDYRNSDGNRRIRLDNDRILIGPAGGEQVLVDQVAAFRIERIINPIDLAGELFLIVLTLDHRQMGQPIQFQTRVYYQR